MIRPAHTPDLRSETSESVCVLGMIDLHLRMGDCRVGVDVGDVQNPVVLVILGTTFIGRFVKGIFPAKRKVVPYNSKPVLILILTMQIYKDEQEHKKQEYSALFVELVDVKSKRSKWYDR